MKNSNISRFVKNLFFTFAIAIITFAPVMEAQAQDKGKDNNIEIKYMGSIGNQPVFQVEFQNAEEEEIFVSLKDAEGNLLYSEKFRDKKFSKRFQLDRTEGDLKVVLTLTTKKDRVSQQYQINRNTRVVEDVIVTKIR